MRATDFIINEVGDTPYSFEPYQEPNNQHIKVRARNAIDKIPPNKNTANVPDPNIKNYSFVTKNGLRYVVILKPSAPNAQGETNAVEVSFYAVDKIGRPNFDITGTGDAANVFATVKNVLAKYVDEYKPRYIAFSSIKNSFIDPANDSRFKLYSLFAKNFSRWFPTYTKSWTKDKENQIVFIFRRASSEPQEVTEQENPKVDLTPNYPNYQVLVGEFVGVKKNRLLFKILSAELKPGQGETEKIFRAMTTNTPIGIEIGKVKNRKVVEDLSRRGFLGGLGAAALSSAGVAQAKQTPPSPQQKSEPINMLSNHPQHEAILQRAAKAAGIKGIELAQFMAQTNHESWDFSRLKEKGMGKGYFAKKYDPKYSPKTAKILGNKHVGDGEKYHGRGFIQLTGRDNYRMASQALGIDLLNNPELAERPDVAAKIAIWYWQTRVKPYINNFNDTKAVTQKINPALRELQDRHAKFIDYKNIL